MAKKPSAGKLNILSVVSFVTLMVILVTVFVLSGSFSTLITTITKSKASQANPKISETFVDAFKDGVIDPEKWTVVKSEGVTVAETPADNLRFDIPTGGINNKARGGSVTFNELFKDNGDFRAMVVAYRPIVTGEGVGMTGIRFSSKGADDDEAATVRWQVNGTKSTAVFVVRGADGTKLESEQVNIAGNIAILRLDRVNKKYRAFYKLGNDLTGDSSWLPLGSETNATFGNEGRISLFTNNTGSGGKFPKVVGRMDQVRFGWEGDPSTQEGFSDAFSDGVMGKNWKTYKTDGAQVYENKNDNLIMSLASGGVNNKPRYARLVRTSPVIPEHKDFTLNTTVYKPTVVGEGSGFAALGFVSAGNVDDEASHLRWVVSGNTVSKLVFVVRSPDGSLVESASVNLDVKVKKLTLRLGRTGDKYAAYYRTGDNDTDFIRVGSDTSGSFGASGKVMLMVNNLGANNKFPRVVARFDGVSGSVSK